MDKRSKVARRDHLVALVKGIASQLKGVASLQLDGRTFTPGELAQAFQDELDAIKQVDAARATHATTVNKERVVKARNKALHRAFEAYVRAQVGANAVALAKYDFEPLKETKKSAKTKMIAAEKGRETRKQLGTMGKQQRKKAAKAAKPAKE